MLEKPNLDDSKIVACLRENYRLHPAEVSFLPLGVDQDTAVYQAISDDGTPHFVKLRGGEFNEMTVILPGLLSDRGIPHIIAPLPTTAGHSWCSLEEYKLVLFPFVEGRDGYETRVLDHHWRDLGATLKAIHTCALPPEIARRVRQETYSPEARLAARMMLDLAESEAYADPVAMETAAFLRAKRDQILDLIERAERFALPLQARPRARVLCHSDLHAGNFLLGADASFYLVDWDEIIMAPKERDLMFVGGGVGGDWFPPSEEERLFYGGYGPTQIDALALAYYRYDRVVQDIAAFCEQILLTDEGGEDRAQALQYLESNFVPDGVLDIAYRSDRTRQAA